MQALLGQEYAGRLMIGLWVALLVAVGGPFACVLHCSGEQHAHAHQSHDHHGHHGDGGEHNSQADKTTPSDGQLSSPLVDQLVAQLATTTAVIAVVAWLALVLPVGPIGVPLRLAPSSWHPPPPMQPPRYTIRTS